MFDRSSQSRTIVILGLLGFFGCFFSLPLLSKVKSLDFKFLLKKNAVFESADEFLLAQGILSEPFVKKAKISSSQENIIYIQKKLGIKDIYKQLQSLPLYYWQVDYTYNQEKEFIFSERNRVKILIDPDSANVIGYNRFISAADYDDVGDISKNESEEVANNFFSLINLDTSEFKLTRYSPIDGKYIFEWEKEVEQLKTAKLRIKLEILGDKVGNFQYFLDIPKKELMVVQANNIFAIGLSLTLYALVFFIWPHCDDYFFFRRREIQWRFSLIFALLMSISFMVNFLKIGNYRGFYLLFFLVTSILIGGVIFLWTVIASSASKLFSKDSSLNLFPVKISYSILLSYVFFFSGMGFTMFFFIFIIRIFNPIMTLGFDSFFSEFPSTKFSCLIAPLLSLGAAVSEEILFRALMISFLKKYFKSLLWPIIISTFIWSFLHVSPVANSDIFPNFVQGIILLPIGFLFSYIFIKFGLLCAITTHYLHDLIVIGSAFLEFNNFRNVDLNIAILLVSAIIPLIVAFYLWHKDTHV